MIVLFILVLRKQMGQRKEDRALFCLQHILLISLFGKDESSSTRNFSPRLLGAKAGVQEAKRLPNSHEGHLKACSSLHTAIVRVSSLPSKMAFKKRFRLDGEERGGKWSLKKKTSVKIFFLLIWILKILPQYFSLGPSLLPNGIK